MLKPQDLLLVPGLLCTAELYAPQVRALAGEARITVANHTTADSMPAIAATILAAAPKTFALCGLSMGGYIAFEIMRQAPDRVTRLALLDTNAKTDSPERVQVRRAQVATVEREGFGPNLKTLLPLLIHPRRLADRPLVDTIERMALNTGATHFARQQSAISARPDSRPGLKAIKVPTLVLVGREDALTPVADSQEIASGITGSKLVIFEDCGHLSTLEQPAAVSAGLLEWLRIG
jgi:pimeloyl-ACP methyl ester carboxylesterase